MAMLLWRLAEEPRPRSPGVNHVATSGNGSEFF
jgi:hypothetical protein